MQILVTSPSGKVGSEVAKLLIAQNVSVRLAARNVAKVKEQFPGSEVVYLDYSDKASFKPALEGIDRLFLAVPDGFETEPEIELLKAGLETGLKRVVKLSASEVENSDHPHRIVEKQIEATNLEWTFLRPNWFMQIYSTTHAASLKQGMLLEPADNIPTAFIDVRDIAAVAVKTLTEPGHHGQAYTLSGPEALNRSQVAQIIGAISGKPIQYTPLSDAQFRELVAEWLDTEYIEKVSLIYAGIRAGLFTTVVDTVKRILGRDPGSFEQFAKDYREVWL